ncbi:SDR family NAD(P)-dependent oxidoreductase [Elizabethkingia meningoseptica]|uniref:SDR family NAD(P)-dependent oxidoreductase n=1 Tax=Elizabethkingia meningoseptica TaxID=238 RepID=UPI0023B1486D|nr:SDR family NAD(P)-dependent oxidoreductase [Elizabethkingia meningoseptica]MDE5466992.1 SDR family NAD(P)-dependent oxidoreductase [Elizabethkingia meningoseptica]MDE5473778.1 SDR family NAD(P)-dependent oxidoreductase [Elizabethkingia meningoseptica]MDE5477211.1 SDR family NAD(P)-dependent oxidoreductase [Elizabethkingia meningoseptica]MDE5484311.1 SDR family NAD(P)-dependent oxidoreductase [Elizabethkingia meningoseptica]MDE5500611.1 SDR family NAD(P)-dependent oxidoreductase [Elizabethki
MKESYAVVTGASQGLGKSFAEELAKRNHHLILVSLPGQGLPELSLELENRYGVQVHYYETDLSIKENVLALTAWINREFSINMLINNAGIGGTKRFEDASCSYIEKIIQLNVLATSLLTHQLLPNLQKSHKAYILNVSSLAAFSPIGYKTVYPASKAFVHSFSRGLYQELKDTNVFVSVVNPGPMKTNEEVTRRIEKQGFLAKITLLDPNRVARYCIRRLEKRDTVIMVSHFSWLMLKILPIWLKLPMLTKKIKTELQVST